jgi:hypothetical protein
MSDSLPTAEQLNEVLRYDAATGELYRKRRSLRARRDATDKPIGTGKYKQAMVLGKRHMVSRLVWVMNKGEWPVGNLNCIDGDPTNTRIENLEVVEVGQGTRTVEKPVEVEDHGYHGVGHNGTGYVTVFEGRELGVYPTADDAAIAYNMEAQKHGALMNRVRSPIGSMFGYDCLKEAVND